MNTSSDDQPPANPPARKAGRPAKRGKGARAAAPSEAAARAAQEDQEQEQPEPQEQQDQQGEDQPDREGQGRHEPERRGVDLLELARNPVTLAATVISGEAFGKTAWRGRVGPGGEGTGAEEAVASALGQLPVQTPTVDRFTALEVVSIDTPLRTEDGRVVAVLRRPMYYPSGRLPGDPAPLAGPLGREQLCRALSRRGQAGCARGAR